MSEPIDQLEPFPLVLEADQDWAALVALAGLPNMSPSRLWSLLALGSPSEVWRRVRAGGAPRNNRTKDAAVGWSRWAGKTDPQVELQRHRQHGVVVLPFGHHGYPDALLDDDDPPAVVFRQGPNELDDRVRVAIVGTRKCTPYGREIARDLGAALVRRGVDVVSGLATGIDAAAHAGAVEHAPERLVAVVAGGVDRIYPKPNAGLFKAVAESGALLSEWPLGATPQPWRFPARNRIVAALSAAVVVVESAVTGGSMYTVDEALQRNRAVFAVPGHIYSPVSAGTNRLLADGAHVLHSIDELVDTVAPRPRPDDARAVQAEQVTLGIDSWLLNAIGWEPVALDSVVSESGRSASEVNLETERLIGTGAIRRRGGVIERT